MIIIFGRRGREHRSKDRVTEDGRWRSTAASLAGDGGAEFGSRRRRIERRDGVCFFLFDDDSGNC